MLRVTKMQGAGNDFVVIDALNQPFCPDSDTIRALCDRHYGIGADQLLVIESPNAREADFGYRIFNNDGQEVEMCGNGARCFALYIWENSLSQARRIVAETKTRLVSMEISDNQEVTVNMGKPGLLLSSSQLNTPLVEWTTTDRPLAKINLQGKVWSWDLLSFGNPHAVTVTQDELSSREMAYLGSQVENHPLFPEKINVEFLHVLSPTQASLKVWERGAGMTLACGSGACAAAVSGMLRGFFSKEVQLRMPGGKLTVAWDGLPESPVFLKGPAQTVFDTTVDIEKLKNAQKQRLVTDSESL